MADLHTVPTLRRQDELCRRVCSLLTSCHRGPASHGLSACTPPRLLLLHQTHQLLKCHGQGKGCHSIVFNCELICSLLAIIPFKTSAVLLFPKGDASPYQGQGSS